MNSNKKLTGKISNPVSNISDSKVKNLNLSALCSDLLFIVIRMRETQNLGNPLSLRKLLFAYIDNFKHKCKECDIDINWVLDIEYAIVALIDETILNIEGECRDHWIKQPLQLDIFQNNIAGEQFYIKLNKLLIEPEKNNGVLEVYYLCLSLGFEGKYKVCDKQERINIIDDLGRKLRITKLHMFNDLSFHINSDKPYLVNHKFIPQIWLSAVFTTAIILLTYLILLINYHSHVQNLLGAFK